jgi:hypothetical protein
MREIPLSQGQVALIDDSDYDLVSQHKWYANWCSSTHSFYAVRNVKSAEGYARSVRMHRLLMGLEHGDNRCVDHANGLTLDNRRSNLRIVTVRQNNQNKRTHRSGKLVGAGFDKAKGKWQALLWVKGKNTFLGRFPTEIAAHEKYMEALAELQENR